jgi:hypothetical protein
MATTAGRLWVPDAAGALAEVALDGDVFTLAAARPVVTKGPARSDGASPRMWLRHTAKGSGANWVLVADASSDVSVNGTCTLTGIRVLANRDEIRDARLGTLFFSDERLARIEPFPGADHPMPCALCTGIIAPGTPAVRCPGRICGLWYHEHGDLLCWTSAPFCLGQGCTQATDLSGDGRWTPEEN